jgi:hypothetical protein
MAATRPADETDPNQLKSPAFDQRHPILFHFIVSRTNPDRETLAAIAARRLSYGSRLLIDMGGKTEPAETRPA